MKNQTKKIGYQIYQHVATNLFIAFREGEPHHTWNVWRDSDLMEEYATGFHTKADAIAYLNNVAGIELKPQFVLIERTTHFDYYFKNGYLKGSGSINKSDAELMAQVYAKNNYQVIIKKVK